MTKRPPLQPDRRPCSLAVRLSPHGLLRRYALLSGMGLSVIAGGTFPIAAQAAPFGSAAWLSQMNAARAGGTTGTGTAGSSSAVSSGTAAVGGVTTAQQAKQQAQHSMNDLLNALNAINATRLAQSLAAQAALKGQNNLGKDPNHPGQMLPDVPDGLGIGGLQIATGADGTPLIQGAGAPTSNSSNTVVTVDQNAPKAVLTWQTFNVGKNTTLVFDQSAGTQKDGSNSWVALNRVLDPSAHPAQILGTIKAQGDVYIIDGSGIIFGGSSQVNTHSLLASSMQLFSTDTTASNSQFLGGGLAANLGFTPVRILVGGATQSQDGKSVITTGDITIQQGAAISTGETGYSLIAAPNVYNYGSVTATDGQAILAAGTEVSLSSGGNSSQLSPTLTGALRINNPNGGSIDLTPEGHLLNDGLIQSQRGNITLVGYQIDQEGVLAATTSVSRPGSITISAHDENAMDGSGPGRGGPLTFGAQSVTAILPEEDGATTASSTAASAAFQPGSATFSGDSITFLGGKGGGALVEAPGAALTISADLIGSAASQAADDRGKHVQGRVYMADGSIIDVSGLADVELPVADTLVTIGPLTENDLADSPLQRGGFLFTQTVTVDSTVSGTTAGGQSWIGSPVIDASAYVQNVPRKIDQLLVNGGSVNLSGSEVITAKCSNIYLDGGFINYLAGMVGATTNLLGADGHVYNIANADPSITYVGFAGQYVVSNPRFNSTQTYTDPVLSGGVAHYDPGFIQGGNAGTLNIAVGVSGASGYSGTAILDGGLSAHAYAGRNQVAYGSAPAGGTFSIGKTSAALSPSYVVTNHGVDLDQMAQDASGFTYNTLISSDGSDPTAGTTNLSYWSPLNGNTISTAGFSHVAITAYQGQIVEDHGATLAVQPSGQGATGSSINLNAAEVTVDGNLTARAGNISIVTDGLTSGPTFKLNSIGDAQLPGNITIGADAKLDASGEWVNDSGLGAAQFSGSQFINGGSISLMAEQSSSSAASGAGHQTVTIDTTGSVAVNGTLDVSSGGYVQPNGRLLTQNGVPVGQGGNIALETYALGPNGYFNGVSLLLKLPANQPVGGHVQIGANANLYSEGFYGGGTLTIQAPGFQIVPAGTVVVIDGAPQKMGNLPLTDTATGTLYLPSGYFQQGFGSYVLNAEYDATIAAGTGAKNQVILSQQNLIPDYLALLQAPTGTRLVGSGLTTAGRLPDYLRQPTNLTLTAGDYYSWKGAGSLPPYPNVTGTVLLGSNAEIDADAGASITLGSANQVAVLGGIVAHSGHILLSGADATSTESTGTQLPNTIPGQSVVLGQNAVLDVSGTAFTNPYATPVVIDGQRVVPQTGKVLAGGSVSIYSENILAMPGAVIDVSGASRDGVNGFDLLQASGGYARQDVWSDAGQITLAAASNLYFGGTINAKAGAAADGSASGQGGSLTLLALNGTGNSSATGVTSLVPDGTASAVILRDGNPLPWSGTFEVGATPGFPDGMTAGTLDFWTGSLGAFGISSLAIRAQSTVNPAGPLPGPLTIGFAGNVNIALAQSFSADASNFIALAAGAYTVPALADAAKQSNDVGGSIVDIAAPYVSLSGYDYTQNGNLNPPQAILGNATLNIGSATGNTVKFIDLGGAFALDNFHDAHFYSNGAIRFVTPENYDFNGAGITPQRGAMYTAGNLIFTASELYPASGNIFLIDAVGPTDPVSQLPLATTVTINGNGRQAGVPLSAGGTLLIDATGIVQSGTIWAPSGNIVLGVGNPNDSATNALFNPISSGAAQADDPMPLVATQNVWLGSNSITSVSLDNSVVPYGVTVDGKQWQYNASATGTTTQADLTAPPSKLIEVNGAKVSLDGGAVVDLSGGGELQAAEWVPGVGGTRNVLAQYSTSYANSAQGNTVSLYTDGRPVYAVIPGYTTVAPYDPVFSQTLQPGGSGSLAAGQAAPGSLVGQAVYLSGAPGLAAGIYTLLPAQYATLPGAFRVVQNSGTLDSLPGGNAVLPDGTAVVAGYFVNLLDGSRQARSTSFQVQSASTWGQYSQYTRTTADSFFAKLAAQAGTVMPQLPMDAGQLILGASADLKLGDSSPASSAPVTPPTLLTGAVNGGAAALIDIASQDIQILGSNETPLAGYLELNASELDKLSAGSLLIGGTRRQTSSGVTITALADSVVVSTDASAPLHAPEILLVTKTDPSKADPNAANGLRVDSGSVVTASGSFPAGADKPITIGQLAQAAVSDGSVIVPAVNAVSGDGALLRVSNGAPVSLSRVNLPAQGTALGLLTVQAGANISADDPHSGSLLLDSTGATAADPGAVFSANTIVADAGSIVFAPGAGVSAGGSLVLGQSTLTQFANAQQIVLRSYSNIDFEGAVNVDIGKGSLTLSAGGFTTGQYGTAPGEVDLSAPSGTLTLGNSLNAPRLASASPSQGSALNLSASEIDFGTSAGTGSVGFAGFSSLTATAKAPAGSAANGAGVVGQGSGTFDFGAMPVTLSAPVILAGANSAITLATTGAITTSSPADDGAVLAVASSALGGAITLKGGSIGSGGLISAPAGNIALDATGGNLVVSGTVSVAGVPKQFFDITEYASGGNILLTADSGNLSLQSGATLDFSANAGGGNAGSLSVSAPSGSVLLQGKLVGGAARGQGGSFNLDSSSGLAASGAGSLDALADALSSGGVNHAISVVTQSGNLQLSSGHSLAAQMVALTANASSAQTDPSNGNVVIGGTIDAGGAAGGEIDLYGRSGVELQGTSRLSVASTGTSQRGGNINLGTSAVYNNSPSVNPNYGYENFSAADSGSILIDAGASINLAAGPTDSQSPNDKPADGALNVRAPLLANGDINLVIDSAAVITGAKGTPGAVNVEAYAVWSTADTGSSGFKHFDGIIDPAGWYQNAASGSAAGLNMVLGTWTDQDGNVVGTAIGRADPGKYYFTPTIPNADHAGFYQTTLAGFVQSPGFVGANLTRLAGDSSRSLKIRPGIELDNPVSANINNGDITIATNWNLGACSPCGSAGAQYSYRYGYQGQELAPVLTIRAGKDIHAQASLSDGFMQASAGPVLTYSPYNFGAANTAYAGVVLVSGSGNVTLKNGMTVTPDGVYYDKFSAPLGNQPIAYYQDYFPLAGSGTTNNYVSTFNQWQNLAQALNRRYTVSPATVGGGAPSLAAYSDYSSYAAAYQQWFSATYPTSASLGSTPPPPQISADPSQYRAYLTLWSQYSARLTTLDGAPFFNKGVVAYIFPPLPPPASSGAVGIDPTLAGGNAPSNMPSLQNLAPLAYATLAGGDSSSYRLVAGAAPGSADPLALQASGGGSVVMSGYRAVTDEVVANGNGVQQERVLVFPTVIRTGSGFIDIAASQDFDLSDQPQTTLAPGAVYTAGVPVPGTSVTPSVPGLVRNSGGAYTGPEILLGNAANPTGAGDISIHAEGNIVGVENVVDAGGALTGIRNDFIGQFWWPWMESANGAHASSINFSAFDQGILSVGGNVMVSAGGDIRDLAVSLPTTWNTVIDASGKPIGGGGNLSVNAGGNIYSGSYFVAKGDGSITAGGQITSDLSVSGGDPSLVGQVTSPVSTLLGLQDAVLQVSARQGVNLGGVYDPSYIADAQIAPVPDSQGYSASSALEVTSTSGSVLFDTLTVPKALLSYGDMRSSSGNSLKLLPATLDLTALGGGISVQGPGELFPSATGQLNLIAAQSIDLYNNVLGVGGSFGLIDAPLSAMPSPLNPYQDGSSTLPEADPSANASIYQNHQSTPLHANDLQPVLIYSQNGSIVDGAISPSGYYYEEMVVAPDKPARVYAGQDIVNLSFLGQNLRDSDVTRIVAGHDLYDTAVQFVTAPSFGAPYNDSSRIPALLLAGPGSFDVEAGRNVGPLISQTQAVEARFGGYNTSLGHTSGLAGPQDDLTGIETVGNLFNPYLPRQGAGIDVLFGVGPSLDSQFNLKVGDFISRYIGLTANAAPGVPAIAGVPDYSAALVAFMDQYQQGLAVDTGYVKTGQPPVNLTPVQAWAAFQTLPGYVQQQFVEQVFTDILFRTGQDYNSVGSLYYHQYARGYAAINALFPASYGYTQNSLFGGDNGSNNPKSSGDLDARNSTIQTQQGGDINLFGPGGQALLGSNLSPPNIYNTSGGGNAHAQLLNPPNTEGVLTLEKGNVNIFTDQSVLLAQSRIFSEQGGNLLIWSSNGDINAGEGLKTTAYIPPLQYLCNLDQYCVVDSKGEVSGAGIATLQTAPGAPPGNVELITPRGTVDAGDAGIRVSGNLTIAALHVANVFNIQVQGSSVGVPNTRVDTGALNAASSAVAAAQQASALATHVQPGAASMISVEVVGFGQPDEEQKRKMRRQREDGL